MSEPTYDPREVTGFTHQQLAQAFDRVRDPRDWRGPIRAEIPAEMRALVARAVVWFTATAPAFEPTGSADLLLATAPGYQRGPWRKTDQTPEAGPSGLPIPPDGGDEGTSLPTATSAALVGGDSTGRPLEPDDPWALRGPAFGR